VSTAARERAAPRLLAGIRSDAGATPLAAHLRRHGPLDVDVRAVVDLVEAADLRGRGGAGFPTAIKLDAVRSRRRRPVVVANGAEGEPIAGKDKVLLAYAPHLVLDGAVVAARAVGAREAVVAVAPRTLGAVRAAIAEREAARIDGGVTLTAIAAPETFVAGEETALVRFLNGGPALPTFVPPRPYERGIRGLPTLVQNVETLAHLALIARLGPGWFRSVGTQEQPGTTLVTLSGAVRRPGVYEIPIGHPLALLLADGGGLTRRAQAFLVGGYFGTWVDGAAEDVALADADLARHGAGLGARAIVVLPEGACGVRETARIARYLARASAGQCGPCVHGLAAVADDLEQLLRGDRADTARLERRLAVVAGRGACRHPDGAVRLVASALRVFEGEVERHLAGRGCCAGAAR
jgi:NADH:ubiquinone oxidoreductase subunit F (NADH-binding)